MRDGRVLADIRGAQIFQRGDKVELSLIGLQAGIWERYEMPITGEVVGFCRDIKHAIRVRLKGRKSYQVFAWWFWERGKGK